MPKTLEEKRQAKADAARRWRAAHPERAREVGRNAYHRQRQREGLVSAPRRATPPTREEERSRDTAKAKRWREKNRDHVNAQRRKYYYADIEHSRKLAREGTARGKEAAREKYLKRRYNLTVEQFDALGSTCAICGAEKGANRVNGDGKPYRLFVDHDHATGIVRGLLCFCCNVGIGYFKHDEALMQQAISYLRRTA